MLAQQIVAICADEEIAVDELHELVRGAYPFSDLSRVQLENVLDMLAGRYPSDEFAELRPRIVWDRTAGVDPRARRRAPARGDERRHDPRPRPLRRPPRRRRRPRRRARRGDGLRGARRADVPARRVDAGGSRRSPATACSSRRRRACRARCRSGRARASAARTSSARRSARPRASSSRCPTTKALERLDDGLPPRRARGAEPAHVPARAGGGDGRRPVRPHDRRRALPRRDRRLARLHPHAVRRPRARAVGARARGAAARLARARGAVDLVGRRHRAPPARRGRAAADRRAAASTPTEIEELVVQRGRGRARSSASRFRENAARALLIPRRRPGERTPLWQQRLKAQSLLQVARQLRLVPDRARDLPRVPAGRLRPAGAEAAAARAAARASSTSSTSRRPSASPYASSLLFDYVATYMYEDDTPPAERRAQALSLDRDLLRELLGQEELRDLLDPDALADVERQLRGDPRNADELHDLLRRARRPASGRVRRGLAEPLLARAAGALASGIGGEERLIAAEDAGRYRDALGVMPPGGLPDAFLEAGDEPLRSARRALRARARAVHDRARRPSASAVDVERDAARRSSARSSSSAASSAPAAREREWCDPDVLRRLRRASLAALRSEVEPAEQAALGRFLPSWHGIDRRATLREALVPLQGARRSRSRSGSPRCCRAASPATGRSSSTSCAPRARSSGSAPGLDRVAVYFREDAPVLGAPAGAPRPEGEAHDAIRDALARGAEFWFDLLAATGLEAEEALPALWDLVWAGRGDERRVDAAPRRAALRRAAGRAAPAPLLAPPRRRPITATQGRWSLARAPLRPAAGPDPTARARRAPARAAGHRHARRRPRRGHPRRLRRRLRRAAGARDARPLPARLLRRGARRRAVRARRRRRAAARAAAGARTRSPSRSCSPRPIRRSPTAPRSVAEAGRRPRRARRRRARRPARRRGRRSSSSAAAARSSRLREPDESWLRPALAALVEHVRRGRAQAARGRALRRRAGGRDRRDAAAPRGRLPRRAAARRPAAVTRQTAQHQSEQRVPPRRLREGARVGDERRHPRLPARGVVAVDEVRERIEGHVLGERHAERQATRLDRDAAAGLVVREPEDGAVHGVDREAERQPGRPARERLAEECDVRVVAAEEAPVDRLQRAQTVAATAPAAAALARERHTLEACPRATRSTARPAGCRCSSASGSRSRRRTRAPVKRLAERLDGRLLEGVEAVGKNLLLALRGRLVLRSHLRMSGRWHVRPRGTASSRGRPWLVLRGAEREAVLWNGPVLELHDRGDPSARAGHPRRPARLRRDARPTFARADQGRAVGEALLDQRLVAGIGNMWKAEALWRRRSRRGGRSPTSPTRSSATVLREAARQMRSSLDGRRAADAASTAASAARAPRCGTTIRSRGQGDDNRIAYWCPGCQRGDGTRQGRN